MAGQIVSRGPGSWLVRVPLGRDVHGKRLYHNKTVKGTKKDAERYRTRILRERDTGTFVEASDQQLASFIESWLSAVVASRVRARTLADYRGLAERHLIPALGAQKLGSLRPETIQQLYTSLAREGLSPRTVRYVHSVLHGALEQAVKWRLIATNPAKLVDLPRATRREMRSLSAAEAGRFLSAASTDKWYPLWLLLLTTGLRPGEALGLKWADVEGSRLRVQRSLTRLADGAWELSEPKTPRARRTVTIPPTTIAALQNHRVRQAERRLAAGSRWEDLDLVFCNAHGIPLDYRVLIRRHFRPLARTAGLSTVRPYDLRHSCATLLLAAGENIKVVSERLGHTSAALTLDVYSHVLPDMQQAAAERLEGLLFPTALAVTNR